MSDQQPMSEMEKLAHLLEHWQVHNNDHLANYEAWAAKAKEAGLSETAEYLIQAAKATAEVSRLFEKAAASMKQTPGGTD